MGGPRVVSVNVGAPRTIEWRGRRVRTGIFKEPVDGRVTVRTLNLAGDAQADLRVHGGPDKAVYLYPTEYYELWLEELRRELPWSIFGENLTVAGGLTDDAVHLGDRFRAGTAELVVTQPRIPCFKLGIRLGDDDVVQAFLDSGRTGFYAKVVREGDVAAGDPIELLAADPHGVPVAEVARVYARDRDDLDAVRRIMEVDALAAGWRDHFAKRLARAAGA
jgi:MOSC domain-containing protein YiiM